MPLTDIQKAFVETYILQTASPADAQAASEASVSPTKKDVLAIWRSAKESTDEGISALQIALKGFGHTDLDQIADKGLNGMTEGNQVAMIKALMEYEAADASKAADAAAKLLRQVDSYLGFLDRSELVALAEKNPFGVQVSIKKPLSTALHRIAQAATV
jgi:hypothetical protein